MARDINYVKDIVKEYDVNDIVAFLDKGLGASVKMMTEAAHEQNLAKFGNVATTLAEAWAITHELNIKLNGEKTNPVL